ncbi:hypothetical protein [Methanospirillum hungatei]|uniref:hypothetical protein n=1 Tax=Methanospirillum hungatei TaxID=2203 RepID=UPI0026EF5C4B|nr:hypothetical protein [Methanospirillum hungatei]MCA1916362.1 hypothetical protein [Methanospirillum hungatei]
MRPSVPYILLDKQRIAADKQVEERNLTVSLFKLEPSSTIPIESGLMGTNRIEF